MIVATDNSEHAEMFRYAVNKEGEIVFQHVMPVCVNPKGFVVYANYSEDGVYEIDQTVDTHDTKEFSLCGKWEPTRDAAKESLASKLNDQMNASKAVADSSLSRLRQLEEIK